MKAKNYSREVVWSDEDNCFVARCPELFLGGCDGSTREEAIEKLEELMEMVLEEYAAEGKSPLVPGRRKARFPSALPARRKTRLNQAQFAKAIGVQVGTLRNWEQGRARPSGAAKTLINLLNKKPELVAELSRD
jgi:putative transcriptional regulator